MMSAADAQDKIFQALADPSCRAIFESLRRGEAAATPPPSRGGGRDKALHRKSMQGLCLSCSNG